MAGALKCSFLIPRSALEKSCAGLGPEYHPPQKENRTAIYTGTLSILMSMAFLPGRFLDRYNQYQTTVAFSVLSLFVYLCESLSHQYTRRKKTGALPSMVEWM
jgi:hypothetical protein